MQYGTKPGSAGTQQVDAQHMTPYLAKSYSLNKTKTVYTFKLRTGLKFPSGVPVDAKAVKCSLERSMAGIGSYFLQDGIPGNLKSIQAKTRRRSS